MISNGFFYCISRHREHPIRVRRRQGYNFAIELERIQPSIVCLSQSASLCILKNEENEKTEEENLLHLISEFFSRFIFLVENETKTGLWFKKLSFKNIFAETKFFISVTLFFSLKKI